MSEIGKEKISLLPCPFCGGEASIGKVKYPRSMVIENGWAQDTFYFVNCISCGGKYHGVIGCGTPEIAAMKWNTRYQPKEPA